MKSCGSRWKRRKYFIPVSNGGISVLMVPMGDCFSCCSVTLMFWEESQQHDDGLNLLHPRDRGHVTVF